MFKEVETVLLPLTPVLSRQAWNVPVHFKSPSKTGSLTESSLPGMGLVGNESGVPWLSSGVSGKVLPLLLPPSPITT